MRFPFPLVLVASLAVVTVSPGPVRADEVYTFVVKKQEEKAKGRWSLSEWLETRDRMRMMDLWLALHSPSPYEFYIGGDYGNSDVEGGKVAVWRAHVAAYARIFGLELQRDFSAFRADGAPEIPGVWHGLFHLRVFGHHAQATNITLQTGLRSASVSEALGGAAYRNPLLGVGMTLYLGRTFGVDGLFRHYFAATPNAAGIVDSGNLYEGGAFIDFKFVRLYGSYFSQELSGQSSGFRLGTRLYF